MAPALYGAPDEDDMNYEQLLEEKISAYETEAHTHLLNHHRCTAAGLALKDALKEYRALQETQDGTTSDQSSS